MRWSKEPYRHGTYRRRSGFLFWPKEVDTETRWLEHAKWTERYVRGWGWASICWEDDE